MSYSSLCCLLMKAGHPILQEKILADLISRNGGERGYHLKMMIPVNGIADKSSLLDLQKVTTKFFIAYLGYLCIIRPLFSSLTFAYLSLLPPSLTHTTLHVECTLLNSLQSFLEERQCMNE